ncbi:P-loop containing nucleoside triphosphate hydrolase protein [Coprinopsis sp. MPI-PUGE-AT-0042]|nr:P-loop containing nucleoside triphosphate hydrolase protein [Coprinopsis sp. MPI-PUGE-AT-0042]
MKGSVMQTLWDDLVIKEEQVGVFKLLISCNKSFGLAKPTTMLLFKDIYSTAPTLFLCYIAGMTAVALESATIETSVVSKTDMSHEIVKALVGRIAWTMVSSLFRKWQDDVEKRMERVVKTHFGLDIPTSLDPASSVDVTSDSAWQAFREIASFLTSLLTAASQLFVLYNAATSMNFTFMCICLTQPIFSCLTSRAVWDKVCYAYVNNPHHIRMKALGSLTDPEYRSDVISANLIPWILKEWKASNDWPFYSYSEQESTGQAMISALMEDLPMAFCGLAAILQPGKLSITSIAIFQTSSSTLQYTIHDLLNSGQKFRRAISSVVNIYKAEEIENQVVDGQLSYPIEESEKESSKGMEFELRDLTFSYPGSKKTTPSLDKINVTIPAGSVVVIVGGNGSGKSTLVKLLARLHEPTDGTLLIDSHPASSYAIASLRHCTALLSQDNALFPLSLSENIGLGYPEYVHDEAMVREAARKGGADGFIDKLQERYRTLNLWNIGEGHPMKVKIKEFGEEGKSRTFMRLQSGNVKFIAVDEPSSAMDAEAELHLFNGILDARQGKTHADLILCMKDGALVEKGTHEELMEVKGEYCKLYKIQADAFTNNDVKATST